MATKPEETVQQAIENIKQTEMPTFSGDDGNRGVMTSSPHNTAGSAKAAITTALRNNHAAKIAGEPPFPQGRTMYYDSYLEGIPFCFATQPTYTEIPDTFTPGKMSRVAQFKIWLLDVSQVSGHYGEDGTPIVTEYLDEPQMVDAQIQGAYLLGQLDSLGFAQLRSRVWTIAFNEELTMKNGKHPRMFTPWIPAPDVLESKGTF